MTQKEEFDQDVWSVLQTIKKDSFYAFKKQPIEFWYSGARTFRTVKKIEEWGGLKAIAEREDTPILLIHVIQPRFNELYEEYRQKQKGGELPKQQLRFDSLNCVLRYGDVTHSFHKKEKGSYSEDEKEGAVLFKKLWEERRHIKKGKEVKKGMPFPPESLATQINIVPGASTFGQNKDARDRFFGLIKGINRMLQSKNFPAKIERKGGIQLVVEEK